MDKPSANRAATGARPPARRRNQNERRVLSHLRARGPCSGIELAKSLDVSAQTASVILRALEEQGLVQRLAPVKGKVGKPQVPLVLNPRGAYGVGLRIGRRGADMAMVDFLGAPVMRRTLQYTYPSPDEIERFAAAGLGEMTAALPGRAAQRIAGIGIAAPYELWNWIDALGASREEADTWRNYRFAEGFARFTDLPVQVANDVNAACSGELCFGIGGALSNFGYFHVSAFIGGAVVLDHAVFHGPTGNAGAFGSIPVTGPDGKPCQLIDTASIYTLEKALAAERGRPVALRAEPELWESESPVLEDWLDGAAAGTGAAAVAAAAVLDITDFVIDGSFPRHIRTRFTRKTAEAAARLDQQGIRPIGFHEGRLGADAGVLGAAYQPILTALLAEGSALG